MHDRIITTLFIVCTIIIVWAIVTDNTIKLQNNEHRTQIRRIVSLSPSITAMIIDLGCEEKLVGITQYCPKPNTGASVIGTITNPNIEAIIALKPDIVIASDEDGATQKIQTLPPDTVSIYTLPSSTTFEAICNNYMKIAKLLHCEGYANTKIATYQKQRQKYIQPLTKKALILLSANPCIAASRNTYISNLFADAGFENALTYTQSRYPLVQPEYILYLQCDYIITLFDTKLPVYVQHRKPILAIQYEPIYMYTPGHYCDALHYIVATAHTK